MAPPMAGRAIRFIPIWAARASSHGRDERNRDCVKLSPWESLLSLEGLTPRVSSHGDHGGEPFERRAGGQMGASPRRAACAAWKLLSAPRPSLLFLLAFACDSGVAREFVLCGSTGWWVSRHVLRFLFVLLAWLSYPAGWGRARSKRKDAAVWHVNAPRGSNREEAESRFVSLFRYFVPIPWESMLFAIYRFLFHPSRIESRSGMRDSVAVAFETSVLLVA